MIFSLEENGNEVNSSRAIHVTEARKPIVEFEGVGIGSLEITNRGEATVTCMASHGRPAGTFQWFMGKEVKLNLRYDSFIIFNYFLSA